MANFTNVMITDFQLPGDDPQGGVSLIAATSLVNPSAFGLEIGILAVDLYYQGLYLGPAQTTSAVNLTSGLNNVTLGGRLIDHTGNQTALAQLGQLFSGYLNGDTLPTIAVGRSVTLPDGTQVSWLNQAIKSLILNVPLRAPQGQIHPIKSITIQTFTLSYTPATAYSPTAFSPAVSAGLSLPFGFSLNISQAAVTFAIVQNRTLIAALAGSYGAGVTMLTTRNSGQTECVRIAPCMQR